jgi:hypothetical protein
MAYILDWNDNSLITEGLQGCIVCDEAVQIARQIAQERRAPVVLNDDDGWWRVGPRGGIRRLTRIEKHNAGF